MLDEESGRKRWFLVIENVTDGRLRQKSGMINFMNKIVQMFSKYAYLDLNVCTQ